MRMEVREKLAPTSWSFLSYCLMRLSRERLAVVVSARELTCGIHGGRVAPEIAATQTPFPRAFQQVPRRQTYWAYVHDPPHAQTSHSEPHNGLDMSSASHCTNSPCRSPPHAVDNARTGRILLWSSSLRLVLLRCQHRGSRSRGPPDGLSLAIVPSTHTVMTCPALGASGGCGAKRSRSWPRCWCIPTGSSPHRRCVSRAGHQRTMNAACQAIGDSGGRQQLIQTV
jgi:hypothetical protein